MSELDDELRLNGRAGQGHRWIAQVGGELRWKLGISLHCCGREAMIASSGICFARQPAMPGALSTIVMASTESNKNLPLPGAERFATTHWSVVLQAGQTPSPLSQAALEKLCRAYWFPLYTFIRRQGHAPEEAQDLTQAFFAHLLETESFTRADPHKGRFRSFLLGALKHFLVNEWQRARRLKRGGGCAFLSLDETDAETRLAAEPADDLTPEAVYERRWAEAVLAQVLDRLREEFAASGQGDRFEALKVFLLAGQEPASYADVARQLGLGETAVKSAIYRLRQRYGELIRAEIAHTVASAAEVEDELRHLLAVLCG